MSDSEDHNEEWVSTFKVTPLDEELLTKLFSCEIDNEDAMLALVEGDGVPRFVLNKDHLNNPRYDFLFGLANVIRRLLQVEDEIIDQWIGLNLDEDNEVLDIITFIFDIIDNYYDRVCLPQIVKFGKGSCSLYNYLCGSVCSLVSTMNEDQFGIVEELLVGNLFSPNPLKALLASDVLCFLCRSSPQFAYDIAFLLFSFIQEIYMEDVDLKSDLDSREMTIEILTSLCNRIVTFMEPDMIDELKQSFPPLTKAYVWKRLNPKLLPEFAQTSQSELSYDKLCIITKQPNCDLSLVSQIVCNYLTSDNEYSTLLHLRLLHNLRFQLTFNNFKKILLRTNSLQISERFKPQFCLNLILLLDALAVANEASFGSKTFAKILYSTLRKILQTCNLNFVSKLYFWVTLQNLSINSLFENVLSYISHEREIREDFKKFLKLTMDYLQGKCAISEQDIEDYTVNRLKNQLNLTTSDLMELDQFDESTCDGTDGDIVGEAEDWLADFSDLIKRNLVIEHRGSPCKSKRLKKNDQCPSQEAQIENQVLSQASILKQLLASTIKQAKQVKHVSHEDKSHLFSIAQQLSQIIDNMTLLDAM